MVGLIISFGIATIIAIFWVRGISNMKEKYPDYKGEDFLNWDEKDTDWDNNHTEGEL